MLEKWKDVVEIRKYRNQPMTNRGKSGWFFTYRKKAGITLKSMAHTTYKVWAQHFILEKKKKRGKVTSRGSNCPLLANAMFVSILERDMR